MPWWFFGLFEPNMSISEPDFRNFMCFFAIWYRNFGTLEITLSVVQCPWKPHKSKERNFLRRNYTLFFFSTPKNSWEKHNRKAICWIFLKNIKYKNFENMDFEIWNFQLFGGVEKKIKVQLRYKKMYSFDLWGFRGHWSTGSVISSVPKFRYHIAKKRMKFWKSGSEIDMFGSKRPKKQHAM